MAFGRSAVSSVNSYPGLTYRCSPVLRDISNLMRDSLFQFYRTDSFPGGKGGTAVAMRKGIYHNDVDLPPLVSVEATRVCILIDSSEVLLAAV
jgi:hypothetical protein